MKIVIFWGPKNEVLQQVARAMFPQNLGFPTNSFIHAKLIHTRLVFFVLFINKKITVKKNICSCRLTKSNEDFATTLILDNFSSYCTSVTGLGGMEQ